MFSRLSLIASSAIALSLAASCGSTPTTHEQAPLLPALDGPGEAVPSPFEDEAEERIAGAEAAESADLAGGEPEAPAPESVDDFAPAPWTGAYMSTAVMLADSFRIEGPSGLLEHVVASSDDAFYERTVQTTPDGFMQIIRCLGPESPEIRVQLDAWTLAAFDRVVILERVTEGPVRLIGTGQVLWRDPNGRLGEGERLEFTGRIGDMTPALPATLLYAGADGQDEPSSGAPIPQENVEENAQETDPDATVEPDPGTDSQPTGPDASMASDPEQEQPGQQGQQAQQGQQGQGAAGTN